MINNDPAKLTRNEGLKSSHPHLAGNIAQTLADPALNSFTQDDYEFLKFHGVYQQDDRDKRKVGKQFIFMVRTKFPGGTLNAEQYLACDHLASTYANDTLRITTRQDFQFHGVIKSNLRNTIKELNDTLITTIAACGDVNRNVMAPPTPSTSPVVDEILAHARAVSDSLNPATEAYHKIWLEGQELKLETPEQKEFVDPLYGKSYLPRKFKVAFAIPPLNDIDIFTNDVGFVAIIEGGKIVGYNLLVGGGMGMSHGNAETFPRLADIIGFLPPDKLEVVAKAVITIHRDFGDRTNRKHARLKYVLEEKGAKWCRLEVEKRAGFVLDEARPFNFTKQGDVLGWQQQSNGNYFLGLFVENGRIKDADGYNLKSGLREVLKQFPVEVRLTASQNLLLVNVKSEQRGAIDKILAEHGVSTANQFSALRLASMACPALPTCGLSLAESERALPGIITRFEKLLEEVGLKNEEIVIRMTGCPNGCARPYMAEIGFVGKAPGKYQVYVGGNESSTRLNRLYKEALKIDELENELGPVLKRFVQERQPAERFGDWSARVLWQETAAPAAN